MHLEEVEFVLYNMIIIEKNVVLHLDKASVLVDRIEKYILIRNSLLWKRSYKEIFNPNVKFIKSKPLSFTWARIQHGR